MSNIGILLSKYENRARELGYYSLVHAIKHNPECGLDDRTVRFWKSGQVRNANSKSVGKLERLFNELETVIGRA